MHLSILFVILVGTLTRYCLASTAVEAYFTNIAQNSCPVSGFAGNVQVPVNCYTDTGILPGNTMYHGLQVNCSSNGFIFFSNGCGSAPVLTTKNSGCVTRTDIQYNSIYCCTTTNTCLESGKPTTSPTVVK